MVIRAAEHCGTGSRDFQRRSEPNVDHAARYVVARDGTIGYTDIGVDYARAGDPYELMPVPTQRATHQPVFHRLRNACPGVQTNRPSHSILCLQVASMRHDCGVPRHADECKGSLV